MTLTGRFLQYYRENANWLERTYAWVPRVGVDHIRSVLEDDAEGWTPGWQSPLPPIAIRGRTARNPSPRASSAPRCR